MQTNFAASLAFTLSQEGGFSENIHDPGGATNQGITLGTYRATFGYGNVADLRELSSRDRDRIYRVFYWEPVNGDALPSGIDLMVFDMGVNAGPMTSVRLLQRTLGVDPDGRVGPQTRGACAAAGVGLLDVLHETQLTYYRGLSGFPTFGHGWIARAVARTATAAALMAPHAEAPGTPTLIPWPSRGRR